MRLLVRLLRRGRKSSIARGLATEKILEDVRKRRIAGDHSPITAPGLNQIAEVGDDRTAKSIVREIIEKGLIQPPLKEGKVGGTWVVMPDRILQAECGGRLKVTVCKLS